MTHEVVGAIESLPQEIRSALRPRLWGAGPTAAPDLAALCEFCPAVYVGPPLSRRGVLPRGAVPVHDLDGRNRRPCASDGSTIEEHAVRVPLARFGDVPGLARDLQRCFDATSARTTVFVDVPCAAQPSAVVVAAATGAVRRLPDLGRWDRVVVALDACLGGVQLPGLLPRPPLWLLGRSPALAGVGLAERVATPGDAVAWPGSSDWFLAPATRHEAAALAGLIVGLRESADPNCCTGDEWLVEVARGVRPSDPGRWLRASMTHWIVSTWRRLTSDVVTADGALRATTGP